MFSWRKKPEKDDSLTDYHPDDYAEAPPWKPLPSLTETTDGYTVGISNDGSTVMKMTSGYSTITLTMNHFGTRQLIRLLEATIYEDEIEEEKECLA